MHHVFTSNTWPTNHIKCDLSVVKGDALSLHLSGYAQMSTTNGLLVVVHRSIHYRLRIVRF